VRNVGQDEPGFGRAVPCVCRAAEQEMSRLDSLLRLSQIGALADCTFATFKPDGHGLTQTRQRNLRTAYDDTRPSTPKQPRGWLVLKGGYGCGKTPGRGHCHHALAVGRAVLFVQHARPARPPAGDVQPRFDRQLR
jgi:DNA replication protein DnaC